MAKAPKKKPRRPKKEERAPEIPIVGEVYDDAVADVIRDLLEVPEGGEATLYIDSSGGSVYSALAIATLIRLRKIRATGMVLSECSSAAILIFAACERRFCTPRSVFLFHRVKWRSEKDMRREEAINWAQHFQWLESEVDRWQASLFGQGGEVVAEWVEQGRFVIGTELADNGLAEIIDP
jgi:ATP-dependent protease ClpP protease subunit